MKYHKLGQKIIVAPLTNHQTILPVSILETGIYWVKIYTEEGSKIQKILVE